MAKSTAVAKRSTARNAVIVNEPNSVPVPKFMQGDAGAGTEKIDQADMEMPRIKLVQGIDQELIATHDGLEAGMFWHTLAEQSLGEDVDIIPLHISKRVVLWAPRPPIDQGGILARADDAVHWQPAGREFEVKIDKKGTKVKWKTAKTVAESGLLEWGTYDPSDPDSQPAATLCHVFVVAMPAFPELSPVAIMLQRSGIKPARKLLGKVNIIGGRSPIYGQVYKMSSFLDHSPAGDFNNYSFTANGFVEDEDQYHYYKGLHEQFARTGVQIKDMEGAQEDIPQSTNGKAEAPVDKRTGRAKY
jgi:hypothetical protein